MKLWLDAMLPPRRYSLPSGVRDATISLLQIETWSLGFPSVGIFEDQERDRGEDMAPGTLNSVLKLAGT